MVRSLICCVLIVSLVSLVACGGSGGGSSASSSPPPPATPPPVGIPSVNPPGFTRVAYGAAPQQFGDLRLPAAATFGAGPYPVAVVVHGGCWTSGVGTLVSSASLADALTKRGVATWNIEYRAIGDAGGGYPGTFRDWGAATDYVKTLAATYPLDLSKVVAVGHSAGAHGALWLAARKNIPAGGELAVVDPLPVVAVVALDGPGELRPTVGYSGMCGNAAEQLLGGTPESVPDRFRQASPSELLPLGVPQHLVSATFLTPGPAMRYRDLAVAKGDTVTIVEQSSSGHFEMVTPGTTQELQVENLIVGIVKP